jgi:arylsulfatase A-like enzyme
LLVLALLAAGRIVEVSSGSAPHGGTPSARAATAPGTSTVVVPSSPGADTGGSGVVTTGTKRPPNIVLVLTDDQRWDMLDHMPKVQHLLIDQGVKFRNGFVVNSFCCPSRTTVLTGKYSHSTDVYNVDPPHGGFVSFDDQSTIATWLHGAGYRTGLFGKYLNGYNGTYIPPGWDRWFGLQMGSSGRYYDIVVNDQGTIRHYGDAPKDYSTRLYANHAVSFIRNTHRPFLLYVAPYAPHGPAIPDPRDVTAFPNMRPTRPASYNESDVSDKPAWVRALPLMGPSNRAHTDALRVNRYRSLLAVDRMVGRIVRVLRESRRLHNTLIVFTSDNGLSWGEHRWANRKEAAYEESIRVPMVIRYDALVPKARTDGHMVLNLDLAETFAEAAGVEAPGAEGTSLLPLLVSPSTPWRSDFLVEHLYYSHAGHDPPTFCAVRTARYKYVEYGDGEEELYDLKRDPHELRNAVHDPAKSTVLTALRLRLRDLCEPPPPGFTFHH